MSNNHLFSSVSFVAKNKEMFLYGAGGHAKVIMDILLARGEHVCALFDDNPEVVSFEGIPVEHTAHVRFPLILSIGSNLARKRIANLNPGEYATAIHPSAIISPSAQIGEGTVVMQGAIIQAGAKIGKHCIINSGASVDHDCVIGDFAHISPHSTLCGNVHVGEGTQIGAGAIVVPGVQIGIWSLVCAGTMISKNVPDFVKIFRGNLQDLTQVNLPPPRSRKCRREAVRGAFPCAGTAFEFRSSKGANFTSPMERFSHAA